MMTDIIVVAVIVLIIGGASAYIIKAKKSGKKCIGCPQARSCGSKNGASESSDGVCGGNCCSCKSCSDNK